MNHYLYQIQPTRPAMLTEGGTDEENALIGKHFMYLKQLVEDGVVLLAGRTLNTDPSSFGIVIFSAENDTAAQAIVDNDPAVANGVMKATLFPYRVALISEQAADWVG